MKITNFALLMAGLSFNALAIEGGTSVNWNDYDDMVKLYSSDNAQTCSGTVIAGKFILTAAHCLTHENPMAQVKPATGARLDIVAQNTHPDFNLLNRNWHDVAVSELNQPINAKNVHFFADLTTDTIKVGNSLRIFGFGATDEQLNYAKLTIFSSGQTHPNVFDRVYAQVISNDSGHITGGHTIRGDSGGAWLDKNNTIIATHKGGDWLNSIRETYSTNLYYSKDFILEKVNGWHYPTLAYEAADGKVTIKVQSLHNSVVDGLVNQAPYTSGDLPAEIGGTCLGMNDIKPYQTCTYIIESQGGIGTLHLSYSESIAINKPIPNLESGSGDSGGSLGFFSLIALFGLGFVRNRKKNVITV